MKDFRCPQCKSDAHLSSHYSILVSCRDWTAVFLFSTVVLVVGNILSLTSDIIAVTVLGAIAPLFISFLERHSCEKCGVEFREDPLHSIDSL